MRWRRPTTWWWVLAGIVTVVAVVVALVGTDAEIVRAAVAGLVRDPVLLAGGLALFAAGFLVRSWIWARLVPGLSTAHAWAAVHVSLLGNHVLPLRLGEPLRVLSAIRRGGVGLGAATASTVTLRAADVVALLGLAALSGAWVLRDPGALAGVGGGTGWILVVVAVAAVLLLVGGLLGTRMVRRAARRDGAGAGVRWPGGLTVAGVVAAWVLEAGIVWVVARAAGIEIGVAEAVLVSCAAVLAQVAAVAPGGFGTYEAGAVAAWVLVGVDPATGLALALVTHGVSTAYALAVGVVALLVPAPGEFGHLRLPRPVRATAAAGAAAGAPAEPAGAAAAPTAPVVLFMPAHDEAATVADVVRRAPAAVAGHPVHVVVVDDGSTDATAAEAAAAGAEVVRHGGNRGLGAAVRTGFEHATALAPAAVAFCDADGEYAPEDLAAMVAPVLSGDADYVVGSRFAGRIERMHPHRRFGNRVLTVWVRWTARRRDLTDGQSGYRAFSPAAARDAEIVHDYNYAQVLTLDLLGKGYRYAEVPITYRFREKGRSFVRLGRYLARVLPAVHRELNGATTTGTPATERAAPA